METVTRTIQWYGLVRFNVPIADIDRIHWWRLTADMIRRPVAEYRNDGVWQPPRGFWGNCVSLRDNRRLNNWQLEFTNQVVGQVSYTEAFLFQAISCSLDSIQKSIENLSIAIPDTFPISRSNPIIDWVPYRTIPNEFSIRMQSENAIGRFTLDWEYLPSCSVDNTSVPPPPQLPPEEVQPLPPNETFTGQISPAYDGSDDNGRTYNPENEPPPGFPTGEQCFQYAVTLTYTDINDTPIQETFNVWGEIFDVFYRPPQSSNSAGDIIILCRGTTFFACNENDIEEVGAVLNGANALLSVDNIVLL